jgi:hypothetical protein
MTIPQTARRDPAPEVERLLALSDERDHWQRAGRARERYAYERGHRDGWEAGRRALLGELAEAERCLYQRLAPILMSPDHAELEARRWGPGGRAHFGDPRPSDFPGRATAA